jgi:hypothetical protein
VRDRPADPGAAAGDDGDLTGQMQVHAETPFGSGTTISPIVPDARSLAVTDLLTARTWRPRT